MVCVSAFWCLLQHLPSSLGFSYLGHGVSLHSCSSKVQPLLLTLDEWYLLTAAPPDIERGVTPLCPPAPMQPPLLELFHIHRHILEQMQLPLLLEQWPPNGPSKECLQTWEATWKSQNPLKNKAAQGIADWLALHLAGSCGSPRVWECAHAGNARQSAGTTTGQQWVVGTTERCQTIHHFMANRWGNNGNSERLFSRALKTLQMVIADMKLKDACSLEEKLWQT